MSGHPTEERAVHIRGPIRNVVRIIETVDRWYPEIGTVSGPLLELLDCGHIRTPVDNPRFGGTDVGDRKRRRCAKCADGLPADQLPQERVV